MAVRRPNTASAQLSSAQLYKGKRAICQTAVPESWRAPQVLFFFVCLLSLMVRGRSAQLDVLCVPFLFLSVAKSYSHVLLHVKAPIAQGPVGLSPVVCSDEKQCEVHIPAQNV